MVQVSKQLIVKKEIPIDNSRELLSSLDIALADYYCNNKDYEKGLLLLIKSAKNYNIYSKLLLGKLYINGNIIRRDIDIAMNYVKDLAEEGNEEAQCYL